MRSLVIRAALAAVLVIVVNGETFESHSIYPHAIISKKTDTHRPNLQIPEIQQYQDQFDVRKRREADPESNKPRPQQVPPRPPHPVRIIKIITRKLFTYELHVLQRMDQYRFIFIF
ncbi:uncharacterized protein LOC122628618 isoform X2 [Vespula pensylvanica]|uniref:uncharacterized protein LOC122628618 isoform X2 n=1 Tax=Vespula pensylvanica TaxID=30213 RepID=UPI001CB9EB62|nr:uncharacterized protein LOC122628618 isoform X2 [Vespula pensylvanica]